MATVIAVQDLVQGPQLIAALVAVLLQSGTFETYAHSAHCDALFSPNLNCVVNSSLLLTGPPKLSLLQLQHGAVSSHYKMPNIPN